MGTLILFVFLEALFFCGKFHFFFAKVKIGNILIFLEINIFIFIYILFNTFNQCTYKVHCRDTYHKNTAKQHYDYIYFYYLPDKQPYISRVAINFFFR